MQNMINVSDKLLGVRHLEIFLMFLAVSMAYALRVNLSVAIVAMTDSENANPDYPVRSFNIDKFVDVRSPGFR